VSALRDDDVTFYEWFWAQTREPIGKTCWEWQGTRAPSGYGMVSVREHTRWVWDMKAIRGAQYAHHVAWNLARGPIPKDRWVLHWCDNRRCVRPSHLRLGTPTDNAQDREVRTYQRVTVAKVRWVTCRHCGCRKRHRKVVTERVRRLANGDGQGVVA
jgi:hypothetical protein